MYQHSCQAYMCSKSALGVSQNLSGFEKLLHTVHKFDGRFLDSLPGGVGQHVTCVVVQVGLELKQKQHIILFILMLAQWDTRHRLQHSPQQQNTKPEGNNNRFVRSVSIFYFLYLSLFYLIILSVFASSTILPLSFFLWFLNDLVHSEATQNRMC